METDFWECTYARVRHVRVRTHKDARVRTHIHRSRPRRELLAEADEGGGGRRLLVHERVRTRAYARVRARRDLLAEADEEGGERLRGRVRRGELRHAPVGLAGAAVAREGGLAVLEQQAALPVAPGVAFGWDVICRDNDDTNSRAAGGGACALSCNGVASSRSRRDGHGMRDGGGVCCDDGADADADADADNKNFKETNEPA